MKGFLFGLAAWMAVPGQPPDNRGSEGVVYGNGIVPGQEMAEVKSGSIPLAPDNPASSYEGIGVENIVVDVAGAPPSQDGVTDAMEKVGALIRETSAFGAETDFPDEFNAVVVLWAQAQDLFANEKYSDALVALVECEKQALAVQALEAARISASVTGDAGSGAPTGDATPDGTGALGSSDGPATP
jgi:hypothetical protein